MCYGTYCIDDDQKTFVVYPDIADALYDDLGNVLNVYRRSDRHKVRFAHLERDDIEPYNISQPLSDAYTKFACEVVGPDGTPKQTVGYRCWYVRSNESVTLRLIQPGDPRLNGLPIVNRKTSEFVGIYLSRGWFETPAECCQRDIFHLDKDVEPGPRVRDFEIERSLVPSPKASFVVPKAVEISGMIFIETMDGKAKWVSDTVKRTYVFENERKYLRDSFATVVSKIYNRSKTLEWTDGQTLNITHVVPWNFEIKEKPELFQIETKDISEYPCQPWF